MAISSQAQSGRPARPNPYRVFLLQCENAALPVNLIAAALPRAVANTFQPASMLILLYQVRPYAMLMQPRLCGYSTSGPIGKELVYFHFKYLSIRMIYSLILNHPYGFSQSDVGGYALTKRGLIYFRQKTIKRSVTFPVTFPSSAILQSGLRA